MRATRKTQHPYSDSSSFFVQVCCCRILGIAYYPRCDNLKQGASPDHSFCFSTLNGEDATMNYFWDFGSACAGWIGAIGTDVALLASSGLT